MENKHKKLNLIIIEDEAIPVLPSVNSEWTKIQKLDQLYYLAEIVQNELYKNMQVYKDLKQLTNEDVKQVLIEKAFYQILKTAKFKENNSEEYLVPELKSGGLYKELDKMQLSNSDEERLTRIFKPYIPALERFLDDILQQIESGQIKDKQELKDRVTSIRSNVNLYRFFEEHVSKVSQPLLEQILRQEGLDVNVEVYTTAEEALKRIEQGHGLDIIITDIGLPYKVTLEKNEFGKYKPNKHASVYLNKFLKRVQEMPMKDLERMISELESFEQELGLGRFDVKITPELKVLKKLKQEQRLNLESLKEVMYVGFRDDSSTAGIEIVEKLLEKGLKFGICSAGHYPNNYLALGILSLNTDLAKKFLVMANSYSLENSYGVKTLIRKPHVYVFSDDNFLLTSVLDYEKKPFADIVKQMISEGLINV